MTNDETLKLYENSRSKKDKLAFILNELRRCSEKRDGNQQRIREANFWLLQ